MTITRNPGDDRTDDAGWPWSHRKTFLERLAAQGYAAVTIQEYRTISGRFCDAIEKRGLQIDNLNSAVAERLRHSVLSGVTGSARTYAKFCARRFIDSPRVHFRIESLVFEAQICGWSSLSFKRNAQTNSHSLATVERSPACKSLDSPKGGRR